MVEPHSRSRSALGALEFFALCALFLVVHALVLRFVFPGYYDPFWPHHADYYIAAALASSPSGFLPVIGLPRPVGYAFYWLIGHLQTRGVILASLFLVAANYAVIVMMMRRAFRVPLSVTFGLAAAVFAYLLAAHPFQYEFSTWDAFSQLSHLLLLSATAMHLRGREWWQVALVAFLAFMAKETYVASIAFLAGVWLIWHVRTDWRKAVLPLGIVLATFAVAFALNRASGSLFVGGEDSSPYQIVLRPSSVIAEWLVYLSAGVNALGAAVIAATAVAAGLAFGWRSAATASAIVLPMAGALSWLPNSVLPNHHFDAYSWNGAYLLYASVVLIAAASLTGVVRKALAAMIAVAALASPAFSAASFARSDWVLMNQKRQKTLMRALDALIKQLPPQGGSVLVSGLSFPFSPFAHWTSILSMKPPLGTRFHVVTYEEAPPSAWTQHGLPMPGEAEAVNPIAPDRVAEHRYDQAWLIRSDGSLIENIKNPSVEKLWTDGPITSVDILRYPELRDNFGPGNKAAAAGTTQGYRYLGCGGTLLGYKQPRLAESCLRASIALIPGNPYPHFFLGNALEQQGRTAEARAAYAAAVANEGDSPNPLFGQALSGLK